MGKDLLEMTLAELWELFPIVLTEHRAEWAEQYEQMAAVLKEKLRSCNVVRISHIGSTAIKSIWAKPIVDILVEIAPGEDLRAVSGVMTDCGWMEMSSSGSGASFNFGYTPDGFADQVYHLHLRFSGDNRELYFRDYLNEHPEVAKAYEDLKRSLWRKYEHNRDAYTAAKTEFVDQYTVAAKSQYGERY